MIARTWTQPHHGLRRAQNCSARVLVGRLLGDALLARVVEERTTAHRDGTGTPLCPLRPELMSTRCTGPFFRHGATSVCDRLAALWSARSGHCPLVLQPSWSMRQPIVCQCLASRLASLAHAVAPWPAYGSGAQLRSHDVQRRGLPDGIDRCGLPCSPLNRDPACSIAIQLAALIFMVPLGES